MLHLMKLCLMMSMMIVIDDDVEAEAVPGKPRWLWRKGLQGHRLSSSCKG